MDCAHSGHHARWEPVSASYPLKVSVSLRASLNCIEKWTPRNIQQKTKQGHQHVAICLRNI